MAEVEAMLLLRGDPGTPCLEEPALEASYARFRALLPELGTRPAVLPLRFGCFPPLTLWALHPRADQIDL